MQNDLLEREAALCGTKKERSPVFQHEVERYLKSYPLTEYIDVLLTDLNGNTRGKRIDVEGLSKLNKGCYFPSSIFAMDILGNVVETSGLGQILGEPDNLCVPVSGTLVPSASDPQHIGQILLTMLNEDGTPFNVEPRNVLNRVWQSLRQHGLTPVVAVELEFYLLDPQPDEFGNLQPPFMPGTQQRMTQPQVYSVDNLQHFSALLQEIDALAQMQGISTNGMVSEASPGQFEINLLHTDDVLKVADQALALKRLIHTVAEKHHMLATFMAKPYIEHAGSGLHAHISLLNSAGRNILSDSHDSHHRDSALLKQILAGMIDLMPASMALLAPNINSYRRFQPGIYVPTQATWGHNNRSVALRIPSSDIDNHRVEYRVAGADANPYLLLAVVLAGILHGLEHRLPLPEPVISDGRGKQGAPLPTRQSDALQQLAQQPLLKEWLGEQFFNVYLACKTDELQRFERLITKTEIEWMRDNA